MLGFLKFLREIFHSPEWIASIALLIQAVILAMQWKILRRHAKTMEEHTAIAGAQAKTGELIGQALQQQGKILKDQTEIMAEQFKLYKRIEAKAERTKVFDLIFDLRTKTVMLASTLSRIQASNYTQEDSKLVKHGFDLLSLAIVPCQKALITSIHFSKSEKDYFLNYSKDIDALKETNDPNKDFASINALNSKYKDFDQMMLKAAQTHESLLGV